MHSIRGIHNLACTAYQVVMSRLKLITIAGGSSVVAIWTVLRHINNGVNYDVIGQLSLTDQWAYGLTHGAQVGSTNYLLKMPIYFLSNGLEFLSPRARLLLLVLVFNLATFLLLLKIMEKILDLYKVSDRSWLYIGMLWLATISGRVYWLDYPNSRNLETVGGILFLYLTFRLTKQASWHSVVLTTLLGGVVFFADPLQFFMIGLPVALYFMARWLKHRSKIQFYTMLRMCGTVAGAYIVSKILFLLSTVILPVSYLSVPTPRLAATFSNLVISVKSTAISTLTILDSNFTTAPHNLNSVRRLLNFILLLMIGWLLVKIVRDKQENRLPKGLLLSTIVLMQAIYIVSGQALQKNTSRYLIMLPLVILLVVALWGGQHFFKHKTKFQMIWLSVIVINSCLLVGALWISLPNRYSKETYPTQIQSFMRQNQFLYAVTARELALPTNYYADRRLFILPVFCTPSHHLKKTYLFFDKAAYERLAAYNGDVPIILQGSSLHQGATCSQQEIIMQLGVPSRRIVVPGIGEALIYKANNLGLEE